MDKLYSAYITPELAREYMGAEIKFFNPDGLPTYDYDRSIEHPKVQELRELSLWSEGQVWSFPELHGNMSGIMKTQIDWIPLYIFSFIFSKFWPVKKTYLVL